MTYKLFLDDIRIPLDCASYMHRRIGKINPIYFEEWVLVSSYDAFVNYIEENGTPEIVSFDHDIADEHYDFEIKDGESYMDMAKNYKEKTGYDCLKWLINFCIENHEAVPTCFFHSANQVGVENMEAYLASYYKSMGL